MGVLQVRLALGIASRPHRETLVCHLIPSAWTPCPLSLGLSTWSFLYLLHLCVIATCGAEGSGVWDPGPPSLGSGV